MKRTNPLLLWLLLLNLPAIVGWNLAQASHGVNDQAGLFSPVAIRQAEQQIDAIYGRFNKDVLVETFAGIPEARQTEYARDRESFFNTFLQERATEHRVNGVYLMVIKEGPPHGLRVQVGAGRATRSQLFHQAERDEVVRVMKTALHSGANDRALLSSISAIETAFRHNSTGAFGGASAPIHRAPGSGSILRFLVFGGLVVVAILLITSLFRRSGGGMSGPGVPSMGGGGFFSSLFGGIAGAMAGSWLYDRFFGDRPSVDSWTSADSSSSDVGTDFASSGSDTDDNYGSLESDSDSTGGDVGGGFSDFGGGDSGGGDA